MTSQQATANNPALIEEFLYRFIPPSWLPTPGMWFDLKLGPPPEDFVSLYSGSGQNINNRICSALANAKGYTPSKNGKIAEINPTLATERINRKSSVIEFIDAKSPHYGLIYTSHDIQKILVAKSILSSMAENTLSSYTHCMQKEPNSSHKNVPSVQPRKRANKPALKP